MKNSKKIAVILVLMLVAVGAYFVSGTYAKYTSTVTGTGTGTVAKWEWTVGGNSIDLTTAKTFTFDLFDTINEADTTTAEDNVAADVIAPGTGGSVSVSLVNASEVDAEYTATFTVNADGVPLEFSTDGGRTWKTAAQISQLNVTSAQAVDMGDSVDIDLLWRWQFENGISTDDADTALGIAAATTPAEPELTVSVTMTQVD